MEKKRIIWADSMKGWLMILVIIGHVIQVVLKEGCDSNHVWNLIYSFHMPAFMAVSGWFAYRCNRNKGGYANSCIRRGYQLIVPYLFWSLLKWLLGDRSFDSLSFIVLNPDSYFWFLWILFWICCLFVFSEFIADKLKIDELIPIGITCVLLMAIMVGLEFRMFGFQFLAYYFIFYAFGYCIHRFSVLQITKNIHLVGLALVWAVLAWFWKMHELPSWVPVIPHIPPYLLQYAYRCVTAAIAILVLFGVAPRLLNVETRINGWIKGFGVVSLGLYVVHLSIIGYIMNTISYIIPNCTSWVLICTVFVATFVISIFIVELLMRNKWTARICVGKV